MRVVHWTANYPHPAAPHEGHAIRSVVAALRDGCSEDEHIVYCFRRHIGTRLLAPLSSRYATLRQLLTFPDGDRETHVVPIPTLPRLWLDRWVNPLWQRRWLSRFGAQVNCDVLHVHSCRGLSYGATLVGEARRIPVALTLRREIVPGFSPAWVRRLLVAAMRKADKVLAPSAHLAQSGRRASGVDVEVVPSGTSDVFAQPPEPNAERRRRVVFVGRIDANKGARLLLESILRLHDQGREYELTFIGTGPEAESLAKRAEGCALVHFMGEMSPLRVREEMRQAMLLCVPSYAETLGLVYIEAMKQGMAVVGRTGTGIDGMGTRGKHFELIERDEELPGLIDSLLASPARCREMGVRARLLAENWTWVANAERHADIYRELLDLQR